MGGGDSDASALFAGNGSSAGDAGGGGGGAAEKGGGAAEERSRWGSRLTFLLAAIGSCVGLGNVWRFPYMVYKYGGGAFLLPYAFALFVVGLPLLMLELALGQLTQRGALDSLRIVHPRAWGVGAAGALGSLIICIYYNVILCWAWLYFFYSMRADLPWSGGRSNAVDFYYGLLGMQTDVPCTAGDAGSEECPCGSMECWELSAGLGAVQWKPALALLLNWAVMWLCVRGGTETVGKAATYTMPLPFLIMAILFVRAMTLDGAGAGLHAYFVPDFGALLSGEIWLEAVSQIFFSLGLAQGIMIAYGSFCERDAPIKSNTLVIAFSNCGFSVFAGTVVFGVIGYLANVEGVGVSDVVRGGTGLAFIVFPAAIDTMPLSPLFAFLFFTMLLTLGIASAFSLLEAFNTVLYDRVPWCNLHKSATTAMVCTGGFLVGLLMTTNGGSHVLDVFDHYLSDFLLVIIGMTECIFVGWTYDMDRLAREIEEHTSVPYPRVFQFMVRYVTPAVVGVLGVFNLVREFIDPFGDYPWWANFMGWLLVLICVGLLSLGLFKPLKAPRDEAKLASEVGASSIAEYGFNSKNELYDAEVEDDGYAADELLD